MSEHSGRSPTTHTVSRGSLAARLLRSLGPAIIVASVVLGPGSILANSKVGAEYGYGMIWVLVLAVLLMIGATALSARLGASLRGTLCQELAQRLGRPVAAVIGISVFLVVACFQFSNNLGVLAAIEPLAGASQWWQTAVLFGLNGAIIAALLGLRRLYVPVERLMMALVLVMLVAFAGNLFFAQPSLWAVVQGFVPRLPRTDDSAGLATLLPLIAMIGTTFSVAGAFYQSYLVREKGLTVDETNESLIDSIAGISVLGVVSLMIMVTSAAVLHGKVEPSELNSAADVAQQLKPLFGRGAEILFCLGIFAGAFSSFLVNAMIGGAMLSDGLGLGGKMDDRWPRIFTVCALLAGMVVALVVTLSGQKPVAQIMVAQSIVVLGFPLMAAAMVYLGLCRGADGRRAAPRWLVAVGAVGMIVTLLVAVDLSRKLYTRLVPPPTVETDAGIPA